MYPQIDSHVVGMATVVGFEGARYVFRGVDFHSTGWPKNLSNKVLGGCVFWSPRSQELSASLSLNKNSDSVEVGKLWLDYHGNEDDDDEEFSESEEGSQDIIYPSA